MPKGVEHALRQRKDVAYLQVIYPLMPKGVEHQTYKKPTVARCHVIYPLMPKGVEHCKDPRNNRTFAMQETLSPGPSP